MGELGEDAIVAVWEAARDQHPIDRALTLLAFAWPERSRVELARLTIGERDRLLLELRERMFGGRLALRARCPSCREASEFEVALRDLVHVPDAPGPPVGSIEVDGVMIRFRQPDSSDIACALAIPDAGRARRVLAQRCVIEGPMALDDRMIDELAAAIEASDPQAEVRFALSCAGCGHGWKPLLDIGELLYSEIAATARALVGEVHALAQAYKWREADILAMTAARRRLYLQMVGYD
jgi:hypothetical protein